MSYIGNTKIGRMFLGATEIAKAYLGSTLVFQKGSQPQPQPTPDRPCLTFTSDGTNTLSMTCAGTAAPVLYYSTDGTAWTLWDYSALTISAGHPLFMYGNNPSSFGSSSSNYATFVMGGSGKISISGNIMTLADNAQGTMTTIPRTYYFARLFYGCTALAQAPELPATTLKGYCYYMMFRGCTGLTSGPALPATTMVSHCYDQMFRQCTYLTTAPDLPAIELVTRCYYYMFYGCTRLVYIKAMFTTTPGDYTSNWVTNVGSNGTFVKNASATWNVTGNNGVPSSWTIQTATS